MKNLPISVVPLAPVAALRRLPALLLTLILIATSPARAAPVDAPELAVPGPSAVGVRAMRIDAGPVADINVPPTPGQPQPTTTRAIDALLWYPAAAASSPSGAAAPARELTRELRAHAWRPLPSSPLRVATASVATPEAPLLAEASAARPVVVLSHGLLNCAAAFNDLAEHLASRGFIVLGLEHADEEASNPLAAALYLRPLDQAAAIHALERWNATAGHVLHQQLDVSRLALVGYSMGGYGALVTAGARVTTDGVAYGYVPGVAMARHAQPMSDEDSRARARVTAVVAIAPWGGQSSIGALKPAGLEGVTAPTMLLVGDQDDISGYADGVRAVWQGLAGAPRWLLTYENARQNIGMNGAPLALQGTFAAWTSFEEPVWRRDRILDINRHFVTAFLDFTLRRQVSRAVFLDPVVTRSSEGAWPEPQGTPASGSFAGPPAGAITQWAGFQRRWALGLRMELLPAGAAKP